MDRICEFLNAEFKGIFYYIQWRGQGFAVRGYSGGLGAEPPAGFRGRCPNIFSSVLRKSPEWPRRTVGGSTHLHYLLRGLATDLYP